MTDKQVALSIQQGETDAITELVERHYDRLMGYLFQMLGGNREQA